MTTNERVPISELEGLENSLQTIYSTEAPAYDATRYESRNGAFYNALACRALHKILANRVLANVLDVPIGTGRVLVPLASHAPRLYGVDICHNMLLAAADKAVARRIACLHLHEATIRALPFKSDSFDAILSLRFFHLLPKEHYHVYINEMKRVLKPNGLLILEFANAHYGVFLRALRDRMRGQVSVSYVGTRDIKSLLSEQGLELLAIKGIALPFVGRIARVSETLATWYAGLSSLRPFDSLTYEKWAICTKK